jgi:hypothetical protein
MDNILKLITYNERTYWKAWYILLRLGVRAKMIDCLYVYLYYNSNVLLIYFFFFSCFIRDACAAIWVAQRVCVYEWTSTNYYFYFRGIVIANNSYCMYIVVILCGKYAVRTVFVLIVWPKWAYDKLKALVLLTNCVSHFLPNFIHSRYAHALYLRFFSTRLSCIKPVFPSSWHYNHVNLCSPPFPVCSL